MTSPDPSSLGGTGEGKKWFGFWALVSGICLGLGFGYWNSNDRGMTSRVQGEGPNVANLVIPYEI